MSQDDQITLNARQLRVIQANPGINFTPRDLAVLDVRGDCIKLLRYMTGSEDLTRVEFKDGTVLRNETSPNLNDFRENFECAAKYGMSVTYCIDTEGRISMVNLYPCRCKCD